ncbi:TPA: DUF551 domain-containing protein [Escherichia coli]|nr:DUF551 domain-containing protein [Escherichia coli]
MSKDNGLKACPFCGADNARIQKELDYDDMGYFYYVECPDCRSRSGSKFCSHGNDCPIFYSEVRSEWNDRFSDWVKCSDYLPQDETTVIVYSNGYQWIADVDNGGKFYPDEYIFEREVLAGEITHWRKSPSNPV